MYHIKTLLFIILPLPLKEIAIRIPIKTDAIPFAICPAASVNDSIWLSLISYSKSLTFAPAAFISCPITPSVDARPVHLTILKVSLADISVCICLDSLAMKLFIKYLTIVFVSISANDDPFDLHIIFPFS
jgi:hypothetical protein